MDHGITTHNPILDYRSPRPAPSEELAMEEAEGAVRVVFPVAAAWMYLTPIVTGLSVALMQAGVGVFAVRSLFRMAYMYGPPTSENAAALRRFVWEVSLSTGFGTVAWGLVAAYHWRMYRRWGRVPRVLAANREGMILTRLGWWRMRERRWAASEIAAVELRPTRLNPAWKRTEAWLYIHRQQGRRLCFHLPSTDSKLPGRIALCLATALGVGLKADRTQT